MKKRLFALALAAAVVSAPAAAGDISYSYVQAEYHNLGPMDLGGGDLDGFGLRGAFELGEHWYLTGSYVDTSVSPYGMDIDFTLTNAGVGWHTAVGGRGDYFVEALYANVEVGAFGSNSDEDGYIVNTGLRWSFTDKFEGIVAAGHEEYGQGLDGFTFRIGGQYKFNESFGVVAEYKHSEVFEDGLDPSSYLVGARFSF